MGRSRYAEKGFSLLEAVVAVAVMAVGIVFMMRAFAVSLDAVRKADSVGFACGLAEEKIWEGSYRQMLAAQPIPGLSGREKSGNQDFSWKCGSNKTDSGKLFRLLTEVSWDKNRLDLETEVLGSL